MAFQNISLPEFSDLVCEKLYITAKPMVVYLDLRDFMNTISIDKNSIVLSLEIVYNEFTYGNECKIFVDNRIGYITTFDFESLIEFKNKK